MKLPVDPDGTDVRMEGFELRHVQPIPGEDGQPTGYDRRVIFHSSFTMEVGETVVVGTSRLDGKDEAMVALLTASR